jgi:PAS domain-containing protein
VILRLWRGTIRPGTESQLVRRLRASVPKLQRATLPLDFSYGVRHEAGNTTLLAISSWPDIDSVMNATAGDLGGTIANLGVTDLVDEHDVGTYEHLPPIPERLDPGEGRTLGVVTATILPQRESVAQSMIDGSAQAALDAGALAAHVGRRLVDDRASVAIIMIWPKRDTMTRFVRSRHIPALDPAFIAHLSDWRFETYNELAPDRLLMPAEGPAVLVVDADGRYLEATPGVEAVLGVPGELLFGRSLLDLAADDQGRSDVRRRFLETGVSHGMLDLVRPDGLPVRVRYRSMADVPGPGLRASVLTRPEEPEDPRPTAAIVADALGLSLEPARLQAASATANA